MNNRNISALSGEELMSMKLFDEQLENVSGGAGSADGDVHPFFLDPEAQPAVKNVHTHVLSVLNSYAGTNKTYAEYYVKAILKEVEAKSNADMFSRDYKNLKYCMEKGYPADLQCPEVLTLDALMDKYGILMK